MDRLISYSNILYRYKCIKESGFSSVVIQLIAVNIRTVSLSKQYKKSKKKPRTQRPIKIYIFWPLIKQYLDISPESQSDTFKFRASMINNQGVRVFRVNVLFYSRDRCVMQCVVTGTLTGMTSKI